MDYAYSLLDQGYIPDAVLRPVIRQLCRKRLREIELGKLLPRSGHPRSVIAVTNGDRSLPSRTQQEVYPPTTQRRCPSFTIYTTDR